MSPVGNRQFSLGGKSVSLGGAWNSWRNSDAVIVGHLGSSLETYHALVSGMLSSHLRVGVWGHIKSYVNDPNPLDAALERWQLRRADQIFAYTPSGAQYALAAGVGEDKVTTLMNTVDTEGLQAAKARLSDEETSQFSSTLGIDPARTFCFIGGLDASKRIDFLQVALDILWKSDPSIKLLVGGNGAEVDRLEPAIDRRQVILLGHVDAAQKARIGAVSKAILMPGRIGLVAVDALVLKIPVVTTQFAYHAPEAEYLEEGTSMISARNDPESYCREILRIAHEPPSGMNAFAEPPSMSSMVENFVQGVHRMMR
ncbi:glycosyltransferase [Arthrobacter sp. D2-10]